MFDLPGLIKSPVKLASIEILKNGSIFFVRTRSTADAVGITGTKQVEDFLPIFERLVAPRFIGKDARQLKTLINDVYRANYKLAGLPFWCPVAYLEQSLLDLLGKVPPQARRRVARRHRQNRDPLLSLRFGSHSHRRQEVDVYVCGVAETGAKSVKFKIGGRMSCNLDAYPSRTEKLLKLAREKLGDKVILRADANGSYDAPHGIRIGRMLEDLGETQAVADALHIPIAYGEQNCSLWQFDWTLRNGVMKIAQPDINYIGRLIRTKRGARIAEKFGCTIVPHNTQTGATSVNIVQFSSCTNNTGPFMEYPWRAPPKAPTWFKPDFKIVDGKPKPRPRPTWAWKSILTS
ncbi:MAG: enolase C-terminal domain-like protein [Opitutaceae bacterium]|nr:enolase C-terminal domain-like protein [Opitutaceae bacterium]